MRRNEVSPGDVKSGIADTQMNFKIMSPRMWLPQEWAEIEEKSNKWIVQTLQVQQNRKTKKGGLGRLLNEEVLKTKKPGTMEA